MHGNSRAYYPSREEKGPAKELPQRRGSLLTIT
jgi:hypothetical protein